MAVDYFDSSALVKRYVRETGTAWVTQRLDPTSGNEIFISRLAAVEVTSALARRGSAAWAQFETEFTGGFFNVLEVVPAMIDDAVILARTHLLRGYDAVHLATAQHLAGTAAGLNIDMSDFNFVSADRDLNAAALANGWSVEDPNNYP